MKTLLGNPMPEATATGNAALDAKLLEWLFRHEARGIQRHYVSFRGAEVVVCALEDRGRFYRALSSRHWEDAVRNALGTGLEEDAAAKAGLRDDPSFSSTLSLEDWLRYRDEVTP